MNKIFIFPIILFMFLSTCGSCKDRTYVYAARITAKSYITDTFLVQVKAIRDINDTLISIMILDQNNPTGEVYVEKKRPYEPRLGIISVITLYDVNDTSSYSISARSYSYFYDGVIGAFDDDNKSSDSIVYNHVSLSTHESIDESINFFEERFSIAIKNSLLPIMEKDYTMLKKFPKYYKRE